MAKQTDFVKTALRVPPDLHKALHKAADEAERTFNGEIIHRLKSTFAPAEQEPATAGAAQ